MSNFVTGIDYSLLSNGATGATSLSFVAAAAPIAPVAATKDVWTMQEVSPMDSTETCQSGPVTIGLRTGEAHSVLQGHRNPTPHSQAARRREPLAHGIAPECLKYWIETIGPSRSLHPQYSPIHPTQPPRTYVEQHMRVLGEAAPRSSREPRTVRQFVIGGLW